MTLPRANPKPAHPILLRKATPNDVEAILRLYREAGIGDQDAFTVEEATAHLAHTTANPLFHVFVATLQDQVVGTYELLIMQNMAKRGKPSGIVEDVAVDSAHQRQGIGKAMMSHARALCAQAGCYKLTLSSNAGRAPAHRFYESQGFIRHGFSFRLDLE